MAELVIDATHAIAGRLGAYAAKQALLGHKVSIVNSEDAIFSGTKVKIVEKYKALRDMGTPVKGPFVSRLSDRFLRRVIRGMLPFKRPRGKAAYANIMCYLGVPEEFKDAKLLKVALLQNSNIIRYCTVKEVCRALGAKQ
jgi:large subunit ribosomal protein L13